MYTVEFLKKIPYFEEYHQTESNFSLEENLENIIDSLTGLISRKYIIGYANYLIKVKSPFRLAIIDLDNFKQINDNYGHTNGDKVLQTTASDLRENVSDKGLCGRFGGDEYLLVINGLLVYDEIYEFIRKMFQTPKDGSCSNAFRKSLKFSDFQPFITATLGVAQYPTDADNYSDLFLCADKALYRGKMKGRNCYIIYLKDKHEGIDISALKKKSTLDAITRLTHFTSNNNGTVHNKIKRNVEFLREFISAAGTCYIEKNGHCKDLNVDFLPEEIDELLDSIDFTYAKRILDLGSGHGIISNKLYERSGAEIVALDISSKMSEIANKLNNNAHIHIINEDFYQEVVSGKRPYSQHDTELMKYVMDHSEKAAKVSIYTIFYKP